MILRALCIGINDYPGTDSDLAGCVNDASDWAAALRRRGFEVATLRDRKATCADSDELDAWVGYKPARPVKEGMKEFVEWYLQFHNIQKQ